MYMLKNKQGITLIALIVTIIVLIILAGVAISMLSGQNGVIKRAGEARYSNAISQFDEKVNLAYMSARTKIEADKLSKDGYIATSSDSFKEIVDEVSREFNVTPIKGDSNSNAKIDTEGYTVAYYQTTDEIGSPTNDGHGYITIWYTDNSLRSSMDRDEALEKYRLKDITNTKSVNQAVLTSVIHVENYRCELSNEKGLTSSTDANNDIKKETYKETEVGKNLKTGNSDSQDRSDINVGDYISYTPPTRSEYTGFTSEATGYSSNQPIGQEYVGASKWKVLKKYGDGGLDIVALPEYANTLIRFQGFVGYNNAVFLLDDACKYLYANSQKGITARSIDYEDITNQLKENTNGVGKEKIKSYINTALTNLANDPQDYITNINNETNMITFKINTWYPLIYKKQANESDPYYSSVTSEGKVDTKPESLTVEYTEYSGALTDSDFKDYSENTSKVYNTLFKTNTSYWLASRCINCAWASVNYGLHIVLGDQLNYRYVCFANGGDHTNEDHLCPVVHLNPKVVVEKGSAPSTPGGAHKVVVE